MLKNKRVFLSFGIIVLLQILLQFFYISLLSLRLFGNSQNANLPALIPLRYSASFVFLWYAFGHLASGLEFNGIGNRCLAKIGLTKQFDFTYFAKFWGLLELLIALSFVFGFYLDFFSLIASLILLGIIVTYWFGANSFIFRDVAILGGTVSLFLLTL